MSAQLAESIEWAGWRERMRESASSPIPNLRVSATEKLRLAENAARAKAKETTDDVGKSKYIGNSLKHY